MRNNETPYLEHKNRKRSITDIIKLIEKDKRHKPTTDDNGKKSQ